MSSTSLPLVHSHHPTTFAERGVAVPFTTPMLLGARSRPSKRGGVELVVHNPAGGLGVYILTWSALCQLCTPTVHDTILHQRIAALPAITPTTIRQAARQVAEEGLAGREAAAAATVSRDADARDRLATNVLLLVAVVRQTAPDGSVDDSLASARVELQRQATTAIEQMAPRLGRRADAVFADIQQLATLLAPIGLYRQDPPCRVQRLLTTLAWFRAEMLDWATDNADSGGGQANVAATIAEVTITGAATTMADARASTDDLRDLLTQWIAAPDVVAQRLGRSEWLVDGWEQICLLWQNATTHAVRRAALAEISLLVPILPKEAASWLGRQVDLKTMLSAPRMVPADTDWRTGQIFDRIARNEKLRALAA